MVREDQSMDNPLVGSAGYPTEIYVFEDYGNLCNWLYGALDKPPDITKRDKSMSDVFKQMANDFDQ